MSSNNQHADDGQFSTDFSTGDEALDRDEAYTEFKRAHESVGEHVDVPEFEAPDGTVSPPDDPLYDSARGYLETVDRVRARADGGDGR